MDRISNFEIRIPILTIEFGPNIEFWHSNLILKFAFGPNIEFWHSKSYFDIRTWTEYRILTLKILFWHLNSGRISNFDIQNLILTFELGPNIEFWHSKCYFDIRIRAKYRNLTFKILFSHSNVDGISNFDIRNPFLTFEFGPNIEFWHSKYYFDIRIRTEYRILTFKILFRHLNSDRISNFDIQTISTFKFGPNFEFCHSKSYFDIRIRTEYRIMTFEILFWHSNLDRISNFDIQILILTFELGPNIEFWHSKSYFDIRTWTEYRIFRFSLFVFDIRIRAEYRFFDILSPILTFEFGQNIEFWHSKSYFDIRSWTEYRILTFEILFWHSNSGRISNFDIRNPNLTFEFGPDIEFWHSNSYFDFRTWTEYRILTFEILFWHSNSGQISNFDIQNLILTFELGPNIEISNSNSYFDNRIRAEYRILTFKILFWHSNLAEYRILTFKILFWHSNSGHISNFDIQNPILTFEFGPNIEFWHSKSYFDIRIRAEYRILTFKILFWPSNLDRTNIEFGHKKMVQIGTVVSEKILFEFLYVHDLEPRSRNDLDLQYWRAFIHSFRCLLLLTFRSLAAIVFEISTVFTLSFRKA